MTGNINDKLHNISRYTKRNANMPHDVIFDVIKPNDARKISCPLNIVQHIFTNFLYFRMEIDINFFALLLNNAQSIVQMLCN